MTIDALAFDATKEVHRMKICSDLEVVGADVGIDVGRVDVLLVIKLTVECFVLSSDEELSVVHVRGGICRGVRLRT